MAVLRILGKVSLSYRRSRPVGSSRPCHLGDAKLLLHWLCRRRFVVARNVRIFNEFLVMWCYSARKRFLLTVKRRTNFQSCTRPVAIHSDDTRERYVSNGRQLRQILRVG